MTSEPPPNGTPDRRRNCLWVALIFGLMMGLPAFLAWNFLIGPSLTWRDQYVQLIGKPKSQAIQALGTPKFVVSAEDAKKKGINFPWKEKNYQPVPDRVVRKEVLLYNLPKNDALAMYVFVNEDDKVEAIDFAGT